VASGYDRRPDSIHRLRLPLKIAIPHDHQDLVRSLGCFSKFAGHEVSVFTDSPTEPAALAAQLAGAEALVLIRERTPVSAALIERLPSLRMVSQLARTTHHIDVAACTARGIAIATGNSKSPVSPAEHTFALILAAAVTAGSIAALRLALSCSAMRRTAIRLLPLP
jgi:D-3-phosphoglycerate dehydrogenase